MATGGVIDNIPADLTAEQWIRAMALMAAVARKAGTGATDSSTLLTAEQFALWVETGGRERRR